AAEAGREADEAMTLALLRGFGAPVDVANRYRPGGFTIVQPQAAPNFALVCLGGVALQWAFSLPGVFIGAGSGSEALLRLGRWWLPGGVGAFWWPGFLVTNAIIAGWIARRWPASPDWSPRRQVDPDRANRLLLSLGLAAWLVGAGVLFALAWVAAHGPPTLARVFALEPAFLRWKAPWLGPIWAVQLPLYLAVVWQGRWRPLTRRLNLACNLAICLLCGWWAASPIFVAPTTDGLPRAILAAIAIGGLISASFDLRREQGRVGRAHLPVAQ
ncbi:MAG TPA: hypothetical protein VKQ70_01920, partial [Caulobacteraceae bacterium]|nr:hypothetical protein [Caulobacteraceae bacterium]